MNVDSDDPKLTAYALGELDEAERADVEAQIEQSEELRRAVDEIRDTAKLLTDKLGAEPCPVLTNGQRQAIESKAAAENGRLTVEAAGRTVLRKLYLPASVAASVLLFVGAWYMFAPRISHNRIPPIQLAGASRLAPPVVPGPSPYKEGEVDRMLLQREADKARARSLRKLAPSPSISSPSHADPRDNREGDPAVDFSSDSEAGPLEWSPAGAARIDLLGGMQVTKPLLDEAAASNATGVETADFSSDSEAGPLESSPAEVGEVRALFRRSFRATSLQVEASIATGAEAGPADSDLARRSALFDSYSSAFPLTPTTTSDATGVASVDFSSDSLPGSFAGRSVGAMAPMQGSQAGDSVRSYHSSLGRAEAPPFIVFSNSGGGGGAGGGRSGARRYFLGEQENITYGYQLPFSPVGSARVEVHMDNRELASPDKGPFFNAEAYDHIVENPFLLATQHPLSTFSIDVDTASYANVRRFLNQGMLPPPGAVRIEEMINYFDYDYPQPTGDDPFSVNVEITDCPWNGDHRLARVGLKGYELETDERPAANLVFLIDVSGSMQSSDKLPLLKDALKMLAGELTVDDSVAIVVYAGASGLVLPATSVESRSAIIAAVDQLHAGGSTNGGAGIELAYETAVNNFIEGGVNRVILATDGDFNVGVTSQGSLIQLVEDRAESDVFLSVLGFGTGNLKDSMMEKLADKGNGNYAYIDSSNEARKVLVDQVGGTLVTIAKDVKIQIEFNPAEVTAYRLIGYENRMLAAQDFNDDTKDAGEIGAGHTVTALYEIVPAGVEADLPEIDPLKYQTPADAPTLDESGELMTVKLRYKEPDGDTSELIEIPVIDTGLTLADASNDFVFQAAVASFGMLLRGSTHSGDFTYEAILEMADATIVDDPHGYREEFIGLVERAIELQSAQP